MKRQPVLTVLSLFVLGFYLLSCDSPSRSGSDDSNDPESVKVPANFNFNTTIPTTINLNAGGLKSGAVVEIYRDEDRKERMQKLFVEGNRSYTTKINVPSKLKKIWILNHTKEDGTSFFPVDISGSTVTIDLSKAGTTLKTFTPPVVPPSLDCNSGCDSFISGPGSVNIPANETYCVNEGQFFNGDVTFDGLGAKLRVCGIAHPTGFLATASGDHELYITETGEFILPAPAEFGNPNVDPYFTNYGTFESTGFGPSVDFENHGHLETASDFFILNGLTGLNTGTIEAGGIFLLAGTFDNYGFFNAENINLVNNFDPAYDYKLNNYCNISSNDQFEAGEVLNPFKGIHNYGQISTGNDFLAFSTFINSFAYSRIIAEAFATNSDINGPNNGYARFDAENILIGGPNGEVDGLIDLCASSSLTIDPDAEVGSSVINCMAYIPQTPCIDEVGTFPGVEDYPGDPKRAFNNFYPASGVYGTLAFEDLWPSFGDYDMNDLVLGYNINEITDFENRVTEIEIEVIIRAIGSSFDSAFGIEFPFSPSSVASVSGSRISTGMLNLSGNGTESGQTNAVVFIFDDAAERMEKWVNTVDPADHIPGDTLRVLVDLDPPVDRSSFTMAAPYNPFIFLDTDRTREIHLPGMPPTDLADPSFFGTEDDDSVPADNRYYRSRHNLNWAIDVPEEIPWPREKVNIMEAYLKFKSWAESGGVVDTDWYEDLPGHRDDSKLYIAP